MPERSDRVTVGIQEQQTECALRLVLFAQFFDHLRGQMDESKNNIIQVFPAKPGITSGEADRERKVTAYLDAIFPALDSEANAISALVPWLCDVLLSEESLEAYGSDLRQFAEQMRRQGIAALDVTSDHVKVYKASLLKAGVRPGSIARKLTVLRGTYQQFASKGLVTWEVAQGIAAVSAPPVKKNSTPALTQRQAIDLLRAIPQDTLKGQRDLAMLQTFFSTGCRVSAIVGARVGDLEFDGDEYYLHVTEKRNKEARKLLLRATEPVLRYMQVADISHDREGPLFRPLRKNISGFERRHLSRKTVWQLVKQYCKLAGIEPDRLTGPGIGVHTLRKTAINDAIRNGATLHEVREFAGHSDIRTTELYFERREEDAEVAARKIGISLPHNGTANSRSD